MIVNEIFYSLQGEGFHVGTPAVFVRFSGCNLRCPFCDTRHEQGTKMTEAEIVGIVAGYPATHVVLTGGEPSLQVTPSLIGSLHQAGKFVAIETNGTHPLPPGIDWITLSPKTGLSTGTDTPLALNNCHEIKVVFTGVPLPDFSHIQAAHRFLQPCDTGCREENLDIIQQTVAYCKQHPEWRLSLQTHKLINIP